MSGDAPSLVLVHGQLMTEAVWGRLLPLLQSPQTFIADISSDDTIAGMAERLLMSAPSGAFDLVGFAMGGFVAFEVLRRAPERVRRLVLISTLAEADGAEQIERRRGYARLAREGQFERIAEERIPALLGPEGHDTPAMVETVQRMARETGVKAFLRQQSAIMDRADSCADLPGISSPALVIRGDHDGITNEAHSTALVRGIPRATHHSFAGCGHLVPLEYPQQLGALMRSHLS